MQQSEVELFDELHQLLRILLLAGSFGKSTPICDLGLHVPPPRHLVLKSCIHFAKGEQVFVFSNLLRTPRTWPIDSRKNFRVRITHYLFAAKEANAGSECAAVEIAECEELRRVDVIVHGVGILPVGEIVKTATYRPVRTQ